MSGLESSPNSRKTSAANVAPPRDYETAKRMASDPDLRVRMAVAACAEVVPEILYYMADDPDPGVRRLIAANPATPRQADGKLSLDEDPEVRAALAGKIASLAPRLDRSEPHGHAELTLRILETLARDQLPLVRQVVAEVLKEETAIPPQIMQRLARDIEIVVAAPVLEFSPLLADADLLEIIGNRPIPGALAAISKRRGVSGEVADGVAHSDDTEAIVALLNNPTAQMREDTLDALVERARRMPPLHEPLVRRPALPRGAARKLATFVADNLLSALAERKDLDDETLGVVRSAVHERLARNYSQPEEDPPLRHSLALERELATAKAMHEKSPLTDGQIQRSVDYEHWDFVRAALTVMSDLSLDLVCDALASKRAEAVVAVCRKAALSGETTELVQRQLVGLGDAEVIAAEAAEAVGTAQAEAILAGFAAV